MNIEIDWQKFRYFSRDPRALIEKIEGPVLIADVPRHCFFGTQPLSEYSKKKREGIEELFREKGLEFLKQNPVIACALPLKRNTPNLDFYQNPAGVYQLALLDGHHRVRYAPLYGINVIPTVILSLSQTAKMYNKNDPLEMAFILDRWIEDTMASFSRVIRDFRIPNFVTFQITSKGLIPQIYSKKFI